MSCIKRIDYKFLRRVLPLLLFSAAIFLGARAAAGQELKKSAAGFSYKEVVLNAEPSAANLPVVIGLHWSGSSPAEFESYLTGFKRPVRIILVQGLYPHKSGFSFYSRAPKNYYDLPADEKMKVLLAEGEKLSVFIEEIAALYKPEIKPVIIGASQGGDLSYVIGARYNHLVSLACPLLATMDERIIRTAKAKNAAPINVFHGTADPIVDIKTAERHAEALKKNGFEVKLFKYPDIKHDIPDAMKADYVELISRFIFPSKK